MPKAISLSDTIIPHVGSVVQLDVNTVVLRRSKVCVTQEWLRQPEKIKTFCVALDKFTTWLYH